ncbi:MAG: undecaprenyl-diphosphate phosphatase [Sphaerochaetaceae bacterium]|jgi:undecaprenyl-diphosphatase|nr:undecaprenyl-diphosphate phosphatase [Sphaerochaetaceae bacterium]
MLEILKSVIFGVLEGITEWLPISSTGHLLLLDQFLKLNVSSAFKELFMVVIQLGAILAVIVLYFSTLNPFSFKKDTEQKKSTWILWLKVVVATIPAAVFGLMLDDIIDSYLSVWYVIVAALFVYGVLYVAIEKRDKNKVMRVTTLEQMSYKDALIMGFYQVLALIPGTSRSGSTILGGIITGIDRPIAAKFSFFMAIPVMFGASLLKIIKLGFDFSGSEYSILAVGCVVSFVVSLLVIKSLMNYVRAHDFSVFGWYRIILSIVLTVVFLF